MRSLPLSAFGTFPLIKGKGTSHKFFIFLVPTLRVETQLGGLLPARSQRQSLTQMHSQPEAGNERSVDAEFTPIRLRHLSPYKGERELNFRNTLLFN
jgi:hypothetical protein